MRRMLVTFAIFIGLCLASGAILAAIVPPLTTWHLDNCMVSQDATCNASAAFLTYWWIALVPSLFIATGVISYLVHRPRPT